ncbi:MAG: FtsX-like permease family protein [Aquificaceae bacterium]
MSWLLKISLRYLLSGRGATRLVSFIALLGISLGVSALLLTMGVFSGFQRELKEKILSASPHLVVSLFDDQKEEPIGEIKKLKDVEKVYFVILYQALISKEGRLFSVGVKALREEDIRYIYGVDVKEGIAVGRGLVDIMGIEKNHEVFLLSPMGQRTPFGFLPRARAFVVDGIFQKGIFEQDYATVVMKVETARELFGENYQLSGYEIYLKDPYKAQEVRNRVEKVLGPEVVVRSWIDLNRALFNALQFEKVALSFVLMLMVLIASFNITSLLFMKAREKVRDIAVLRTYGLKSRQVFLIFITQGLLLGLVGTMLGFLLSFIGSLLINKYKLIRVPADVYLMEHIPVYFEVGDMVFTMLGAFLLSLLSSLLPAYKTSRESIVRVLRNE